MFDRCFLFGRLLLGTSLLWGLAGCGPTDLAEELAADAAAVEPSEIELATLMGELQRHSAKLGYSIEGTNQPLAEFYLHEVEEVLGELYAIEDHEGMPIGDPAGVIMRQLVIDLDEQLQIPSWPSAQHSYRNLIAGCNRCHTATEHAFIEILQVSGPAPFNQRFAASPVVVD